MIPVPCPRCGIVMEMQSKVYLCKSCGYTEKRIPTTLKLTAVKQEEADKKVADLWRRLDLSQLADIEDLPDGKKKAKGKYREDVDREIEAEWIRNNLK